MTSAHHAVVEVSADAILLRVDNRWRRFTASEAESSAGGTLPFQLNEDGTVALGDATSEMDLAAEAVARDLLAG